MQNSSSQSQATTQGAAAASQETGLTFSAQKQLPVVPLPNLQYSCASLMDWCSPVLSEEEKQATQVAVDSFVRPGGPGEKLHTALLEYARQPGVVSWLDRFWQTRYLGRRAPLVPDANFIFKLADETQPQIDRAAELIAKSFCYKLELDKLRVEPVTIKGVPYCMEQIRRLFASTRIPRKGQDELRSVWLEGAPGLADINHILVFRKGHIFKLNLVGANGKPHTLDALKQALGAIISGNAVRADAGDCIGHLTTLPREDWAEAREDLISLNEGNRGALDVIETALFAVCLDDIGTETLQDGTDNLLHGDSANRWYDKALQFIVCANGRAGTSSEHSGIDGMILMNMVDAIAEYDAEGMLIKAGAENQGAPVIEQISFVIDDDLRKTIIAAGDGFIHSSEHAATSLVVYDSFGVNRVKTLGVSPDSFIQMCFQAAHYRTKGFTAATYESVAMRQYENGRTEAMRVVTPEAAAFAKAFNDLGVSETDKIATFREAANAHVLRAKQCQAGQAPEQHLWELQNIYNAQKDELGITEELTLFETPGWNKMRDDVMSTTSISSPNLDMIGFGSTATRCIGISYFYRPDAIMMYMCTPGEYALEFKDFETNLTAVFGELAEMIERNA